LLPSPIVTIVLSHHPIHLVSQIFISKICRLLYSPFNVNHLDLWYFLTYPFKFWIEKKQHYLSKHFRLQYTIIFLENLPIIKKNKKKSPQDGRQMVKMKFNSCKIIPHYCNNIFALHMQTFTISILFLNTFNIAIH
jgi:hypothetical protein